MSDTEREKFIYYRLDKLEEQITSALEIATNNQTYILQQQAVLGAFKWAMGLLGVSNIAVILFTLARSAMGG